MPPPPTGRRALCVRGATGAPSLERTKALSMSDGDEALSGLLEWADPIVFDSLRECYGFRLEETRAALLAHRQARQWRALIAGDVARFEALRRDVAAALVAFDLDAGCALEADACVLAELYEIAMARFGRSPRSAQAYRAALKALAARLAPVTGARLEARPHNAPRQTLPLTSR